MRKLIITALMLLGLSIGVQAQSVVREGMTFKSVTKSSNAKADTLLTAYKFEDSKGTLYPIIVNKQTGRCWVWKKSSKTGKIYKMYVSTEIAKTVCKELGINYKEVNK